MAVNFFDKIKNSKDFITNSSYLKRDSDNVPLWLKKMSDIALPNIVNGKEVSISLDRAKLNYKNEIGFKCLNSKEFENMGSINEQFGIEWKKLEVDEDSDWINNCYLLVCDGIAGKKFKLDMEFWISSGGNSSMSLLGFAMGFMVSGIIFIKFNIQEVENFDDCEGSVISILSPVEYDFINEYDHKRKKPKRKYTRRKGHGRR